MLLVPHEHLHMLSDNKAQHIQYTWLTQSDQPSARASDSQLASAWLPDFVQCSPNSCRWARWRRTWRGAAGRTLMPP